MSSARPFAGSFGNTFEGVDRLLYTVASLLKFGEYRVEIHGEELYESFRITLMRRNVTNKSPALGGAYREPFDTPGP